jgi:hypothetical protein
MTFGALYIADLIAIAVLVFGLYFPRHHRRDMVVAYIGINVGVLAVAQALGASPVSAGLGLGLFGVLSIIRLRSTEMEQDEVAYYFCALALGLLGGFPLSPVWLSLVLMASVIGAVAVADHARLLGGYRRQLMVLDRAFSTEREAILYAAALLEAKILNLRIDKVDLVPTCGQRGRSPRRPDSRSIPHVRIAFNDGRFGPCIASRSTECPRSTDSPYPRRRRVGVRNTATTSAHPAIRWTRPWTWPLLA